MKRLSILVLILIIVYQHYLLSRPGRSFIGATRETLDAVEYLAADAKDNLPDHRRATMEGLVNGRWEVYDQDD